METAATKYRENISESLFPEKGITVEGFPWCKGTPVQIGMAGLTAKILCERHNNDLSPVDEAAANAFDVFRQTTGLANVRGKLKQQRWTVKRFHINGRALERWCLKTLVNICCDKIYPIGRDSEVPGRSSERLVKMAYGREPFVNRAGLYFVVRVGMESVSRDMVQFAPLIKLGKRIEGGLFTFRGVSLLLFLEPEGPPEPLAGIMLNEEDLGNMQLNFHNQQIKWNSGKYLSHVVHIQW